MSDLAFTKDDAEALGVQFVRYAAPGPEGTSKYLADHRRGGAAVSWSGDSEDEVLTAISDWHATRVAMGVADAPLKISTTGTVGPGA